ncbi:hypothetical protein TVAG_199560 [Trichomonas vaginalis G3]|uniref:F5/8 type C domain containing protein n=1 Tax=Trichomonas vaginalis (strain ATCC PRA-98 / G3) TaxID=412133 RepID=A2DDZ1_TRIV3|nr:galactose-binding domain-like family [Trichomonas vaginalis G3]EAY21517.1 hypothetical protein TVAG_199560 [Trichomonas vaginalis G3]KAI5490733.1 galactose-binding domain-like family [Trichomonas vaginalis G3]|eukprot:XP_001582503.1 hypothetical protein [Trichomonas vaginalis G3]
MERFDLSSFAYVQRWATLDLIYNGKHHWVIPDVLVMYSHIIATSKKEIQVINIPNIPGPFDEFIEHLYYGSFQINSENARFYFAIGIALGIEDLTNFAKKYVENCELDLIIDLANKLAECNLFDDGLIQTIAKDFGTALTTPSIRNSPAPLISKIKSSQMFVLHNPVEFGNYVLSRIEFDSEFEPLLVSYLESAVKSEDISLLPRLLSYPNINLSKYSHILDKIMQSISGSEEYYRFDSSNPRNGFIHKNMQHIAQPVNEKGTFSINVSSSDGEKFGPLNLFQDKSDVYYCSGDQNSVVEWIQIEFHTGKFLLIDYILESYYSTTKTVAPIKWRVEGSNDENEWEILDERDEETLVKAQGPVKFHISNNTKIYSMYRITQLENNGTNNKRFILQSFDVFGTYTKH